MQMRANAIYCGDCTQTLAYFPECSVDLIYVDPPFFSNKQYEIIWGNGYELKAFEDRWKGDINNYIAWMEPKIRECHRVLKPTGSMYLHCDWHASHHLRLMMDKIFGENNFRNEIIWHYRRWTAIADKFQKLHDNIYFYTKSEKYTFTPQYEPYGEWIEKDYRYVDKNGRRWRWHTVKGRRYKVYLEDKERGVKMGDVWLIPFIGSTAKERLGYPTQKPEKLLERIILASSNPMDIVLDPMCGCGTAIAVAHRLGRRWIGIDVSPKACKIMVKRMRKLGVKITENDIIGLPKTVEELKAMVPFEFQDWVIEKLYARPSKSKVGDFGVDGWLPDGRPLQIKQLENVGRNVVDNFETAIRRQGKKTGMIVAFSFGKGAHEEVARAKLKEGLEIELKEVKEIIREA
ncbi:MAG: DNA methyltransferase [Candidatus Bathyarchaeia archaeon]